MWYVCFMCGVFIGVFIGVFVMCLAQMNNQPPEPPKQNNSDQYFHEVDDIDENDIQNFINKY